MQIPTIIKVGNYYLILGVTLYNLGLYDQALTMYDHALEVNPNHAKTYHKKGINSELCFRSFVKQFRKIWWGNQNVWYFS